MAEASKIGGLPEAPLSAKFGKYRLLARMARGGMGDIYLALSEGPASFRKLVVIKLLRAESDDVDGYRSMFLDEGALAARLNHPHVVQTHEVGEADEQLFLVMDYLEGQPLSRVLRAAGRLPSPLAARIVADALSGLHYAHELRDFDGSPLSIVHRDLSPQNVFVTYDGTTKLLDFGIAKAALCTRALTEVGVLKGRISYMSPEHANGSDVDRRADVFAMGVVLWELATGRRLINGKLASQALKTLMDAEPLPRLSAASAEADPELEPIVARALEKRAEARYQTAEEMRVALEQYLAAKHVSIRSEHIGQFMLSHFSSQRTALEAQVRTCLAAEQATSGGKLPILGPRARLGSGSGSEVSGVTHQGTMNLEPSDPNTASTATRDFGRELRAGPSAWVKRLMLVAALSVTAGGLTTRACMRAKSKSHPQPVASASAKASPTVRVLAARDPAPSAPRGDEQPMNVPALARESQSLSSGAPPTPARWQNAPRRAPSAPREGRASAQATSTEPSAERAPAAPAPAVPARRRVSLVDDGQAVELLE